MLVVKTTHAAEQPNIEPAPLYDLRLKSGIKIWIDFHAREEYLEVALSLDNDDDDRDVECVEFESIIQYADLPEFAVDLGSIFRSSEDYVDLEHAVGRAVSQVISLQADLYINFLPASMEVEFELYICVVKFSERLRVPLSELGRFLRITAP